jgi:hypothetical protein
VQGVVLMRNCPLRSQGEVKDGGYWDTGPINRVKEPLVLILGQPPRTAASLVHVLERFWAYGC